MKKLDLIKQANNYKGEWFWKALPGYMHFIFGLAEGIVRVINMRFGYGFEFNVCYHQGDSFTWFWRTAVLIKMRTKFIKKVTSNPRFIVKFKQLWLKDMARFDKVVNEVNNTDLSVLSDEDLNDLYYKLYGHYNWAMSLGQQTDCLLSAGSEDWFHALLREQMPKLRTAELQEVFAVLSAPVYASFYKSEELDLLRLAGLITKKPGLKKVFKQNKQQKITTVLNKYPKIFSQIKKHRDSFYWAENNYHRVFNFSVSHYLKEISRIFKKDIDLLVVYKKELNQINKIKQAKQKIIKKYKVNKYITNIVRLMEEFTIIHDSKKGVILRNNHSLHLFLREISKRTGIPLIELFYSTAFEIGDILLKRKYDRKLFKQRIKACAFIFNNRSHLVVSGHDLKKLNIKKLYGIQKKITVVQGVCACPGNIEGQVRVVVNDKDFRLMKKGEILITNNTTPEFVPLMKKARAVVTEQGGMTTHAAIVSRELGVPCVIGTKNATLVFKTGDRVKVNALKGVVKKI
ncbi:hypothetical protein KKF61_03185 [Patescibacteria group bacterium]|nr:hypothetical protein [Patescibacteria group bacterium]MBU0964252.1 hypothetical protein [Patescibacteria group bacterium]